MRRGYKVDEVDSFLDRVEATLSGDPMGAPVSAQEVHDVVFRVRFGGYDEWQVDLHLDRVERQLAELEERGSGGGFGRALDSRSGELRMQPERMPERMESHRMPDRVGMAPPPPDRLGPPGPDRMGPPPGADRMGPPPGPDRMGPPPGPDRMGPPGADRMGPPPGPERMGPPGADRMGPPPGPERMGPPMDRPMDRMGPPPMDRTMERPAPPPPGAPLPTRPTPAPGGQPPRDQGYGRYDEPTYGGAFDEDRAPYDQAPRAPRADMTAEIRLDRPEPPTYGGGPGPGPGPMGGSMTGAIPAGGMDRDPYGGPPERDPYGAPPERDPYGAPPERDPYGAPPEREPYGAPAERDPYGGPQGGPPVQHQSTEVARIDQLRRTFQLRRFGSGYDRSQVDRLFEGVMASLTGRGGPLTDGDLDPSHFNLVPGGYFEAEVDAALKEVRDIVTRRR
ncbi:DivIVA domain-containing protein [Dactylosporangium sp. CA-233914]|uniref:DivIVA domain-containing protein n=1 Tax=Dactylosporangium sp. CA-233914 TaxID=3239934 RepID=UPI003D90336B